VAFTGFVLAGLLVLAGCNSEGDSSQTGTGSTAATTTATTVAVVSEAAPTFTPENVAAVPTEAVVDTPAPPDTATPEPPVPTTVPTDTAVPPPPPTDTAVPPPPPPDTPEPLPTDTPEPLPTDTPEPPPPTRTPLPVAVSTDTAVPEVPTPTAVVEDAQVPAPELTPEKDMSRVVNGKYYDAYIDAATKKQQYYHYTCEFDAAWVVLASYGFEATLEDQINIVGIDDSVEPRYEETADGVYIYGGDIFNHYSGDYKENFMARSTGRVMRKVFEAYGLQVTPVNSRESLEAALRRGELVWIKTTADFKLGRPATWVMPNGETYLTVLGNDHAAVVMGYSERGALIRDVLGPTSTNWQREYEYEVPWKTFLNAWAQQQNDGLAVASPGL
jgi:hypothetical protein